MRMCVSMCLHQTADTCRHLPMPARKICDTADICQTFLWHVPTPAMAGVSAKYGFSPPSPTEPCGTTSHISGEEPPKLEWLNVNPVGADKGVEAMGGRGQPPLLWGPRDGWGHVAMSLSPKMAGATQPCHCPGMAMVLWPFLPQTAGVWRRQGLCNLLILPRFGTPGMAGMICHFDSPPKSKTAS